MKKLILSAMLVGAFGFSSTMMAQEVAKDAKAKTEKTCCKSTEKACCKDACKCETCKCKEKKESCKAECKSKESCKK